MPSSNTRSALISKNTLDSSFTQFAVFAAEGDLRAELQIDCESQDPRFEKKPQVKSFFLERWSDIALSFVNTDSQFNS